MISLICNDLQWLIWCIQDTSINFSIPLRSKERSLWSIIIWRLARNMSVFIVQGRELELDNTKVEN